MLQDLWLPVGLVQERSAEAHGEDMAVERAEQAKQELLPEMTCLQWQDPDACIQQSTITDCLGMLGTLACCAGTSGRSRKLLQPDINNFTTGHLIAVFVTCPRT